MINQQIQKYKIISLLGEGGMANVYLVEHITLGQNYALKMLKQEFVQHPNIRKRFLAEARNLAKIQHPNVIKVTDLIDAGDIVAFVMEQVEGVSLEHYIANNAPLSNETIEKLFLQMIDAVDYIHSQGLIHRDIKPSNFMVAIVGNIKLLDFGIAKNLNEDAVDYTKTSKAQQMGTPMYMSPEQVRNTSEITRQTDIYSLGVVLWQMIMNKKPYNANTLTLPEIQVAIMKDPLPLTKTSWDLLIEKLTEKELSQRLNSIESVRSLFDKEKVFFKMETELIELVTDYQTKIKNKRALKRNSGIGLVVIVVSIFVYIKLLNQDILVAISERESKYKIQKSNDTLDILKPNKTKINKDTTTIIHEQKQLPDNITISNKLDNEEIVTIKKTEYDKVRVGDLDVMKNDFIGINWYDAIRKSHDMGDGWRLPTAQEMAILLSENKNSIGGFNSMYYWTSTTSENVAFAVESRNITMTSYNKSTVFSVRMVRSIK
jgi:serine/threonine protein kinase